MPFLEQSQRGTTFFRGLNLPYSGFWLILLSIGLLLPLLGYGLMPALGFSLFSGIFSPLNIALVVLLVAGGMGYIAYYRFVEMYPHVLLYFMAIFWPLAEFGNQFLLEHVGLNLHLRLILMLLLAIPAFTFGLRQFRFLCQTVPQFKLMLAFWGILVTYFLFYNSHAVDPRWNSGNVWSEGSVGVVQFVAYMYCLLGSVLAAVSLNQHPHPTKLFNTFNTTLLIVTSVESLFTLLGYPFGSFSTHLDGFHRAMGFFTHPNPFAHHMGILLIYMLGLFCYYQGDRKGKIPGWLLVGGITINLIAFLLGLSKTAIAVFSLCALLMALLNLSIPIVRRCVAQGAFIAIFALPLCLWGFQLVTDQSFLELLQARFDQSTSFYWRLEIWRALLANIDLSTLLVGHGFTAANAWVFQLTFNDRLNAQPLMMVHNGYIGLLYDFGILGWLLFAAAIALMFKAFKGIRTSLDATCRPLLVTVIAMALYFLLVCGFDEMTYMFDAPILFWTLSTLMYSVAMRSFGR